MIEPISTAAGINTLMKTWKGLKELLKLENISSDVKEQMDKLQNQLYEAKNENRDLKDENRNLKDENRDLKDQIRELKKREKISDNREVDRDNLLWLNTDEGKKGPYCSKCYDTDANLVSLHHKSSGSRGNFHECPACGTKPDIHNLAKPVQKVCKIIR